MPKQIEQLDNTSMRFGYADINAIIELHNKGHQLVLEVENECYYVKFAVYQEEVACRLSHIHFMYLCQQANDKQANVWFDLELTDINDAEADELMKTFPLIRHV